MNRPVKHPSSSSSIQRDHERERDVFCKWLRRQFGKPDDEQACSKQVLACNKQVLGSTLQVLACNKRQVLELGSKVLELACSKQVLDSKVLVRLHNKVQVHSNDYGEKSIYVEVLCSK